MAGLPAGRCRTKATTPEAIPLNGVVPGYSYIQIHTKKREKKGVNTYNVIIKPQISPIQFSATSNTAKDLSM